MELRQLRYLVAISEEQNINRAAKLCFVTQPALTQQIKKLEDEFNTSLLIRRGRGIVLSEDGERLTQHAKNLIKKVDAIKKEFLNCSNKNVNQILLGTVPAIHKFIDPDSVSGLSGMNVKVRKMCNDQMEYELRRGLINAGITTVVPGIKNVSAIPIAREKIYLVASIKHKLHASKTVNIDSVSDEPLALLSKELIQGEYLDTYLKTNKINMKVVLEVDSCDELVNVIKHSNFISIIPNSLISNFENEEICSIEITNNDFYRNFFLVWDKSKQDDEMVQRLHNSFPDLTSAIN